jgi:hypothetical protein
VQRTQSLCGGSDKLPGLSWRENVIMKVKVALQIIEQGEISSILFDKCPPFGWSPAAGQEIQPGPDISG